MKTEYRNSDPIIVKDDKTGSETREYQDNMEEILMAENEKELLLDTLEEKKSILKYYQSSKFKLVYSKKMEKILNFILSKDKCIGVLAEILLLAFITKKCITSVSVMDTIVRVSYGGLSFGTIILIIAYLHILCEAYIRSIKKVALLKEEIPFLEEELKRQNEKEEELKSNKTQNIDPTNEIVSLKEQNEYRQGLLKKRMALIESYYENKESQPSFENNLLLNENITEEEQEIKEVLLRLVAKKIEKK